MRSSMTPYDLTKGRITYRFVTQRITAAALCLRAPVRAVCPAGAIGQSDWWRPPTPTKRR
jgi:hypothetical protein